MARYLYSELSNLITARANCNATLARISATANQNPLSSSYDANGIHRASDLFDKHTSRIEELVSDHMPSGSGFDSGTKLDLDSSHAEKLVFTTSFHHMNDAGMYCGWTDHTITVTPSLLNRYHLRISGRNRNDIKEYMHEVFSSALDFDLQPGMDWDATVARVGCEVKSTWVDSCTQRWYVVHDGAVISTDGFASWADARAWAVAHFQEVK